jgi:hypothetical protein
VSVRGIVQKCESTCIITSQYLATGPFCPFNPIACTEQPFGQRPIRPGVREKCPPAQSPAYAYSTAPGYSAAKEIFRYLRGKPSLKRDGIPLVQSSLQASQIRWDVNISTHTSSFQNVETSEGALGVSHSRDNVSKRYKSGPRLRSWGRHLFFLGRHFLGL